MKPCRQILALVSQPRTALRRGLTLIELMCTLAITAVLLGNALPMLNDLAGRQRLQAAAEQLETDIHLARSAALASGRTVRLQVQAVPNGTTCYVIHDGPAQACTCQGGGQARCNAGVRLLRLAEQDAQRGITLNTVQQALQFDAGKGTVTPTATLKVTDRDGRAVHQIVNIMGRVRTCSPSAGMAGLRPC